MLTFIRSGPRFIKIYSNDLVSLIKYIKGNFTMTEYLSIKENGILDMSNFNNTIRFKTMVLIMNGIEADENSCIEKAYYTTLPLNDLLIRFINNKPSFQYRFEQSSQLLFMKTLGNVNKIIKLLVKDYNASVLNGKNHYHRFNKGTLIQFATESVSETIVFSDIYHKTVFIPSCDKDIELLLSQQIFRFINTGIGNKSWYNLTIKIYDSYQQYELHYNRLMFIFKQLGIGLINNESWGTDMGFSLLTVDTYNITIFTYLKPEVIKELLLGMEYKLDGERCVDLDLYYRHKKISWTTLQHKRKINREELGHMYRSKLYNTLGKASEKFALYEEDIKRN